MKHPHHDMIIEWVKDTTRVVQVSDPRFADECWIDVSGPTWQEDLRYRFKPVPKPDTVSYLACWATDQTPLPPFIEYDRVMEGASEIIKITRCEETGLLKSAEVLK